MIRRVTARAVFIAATAIASGAIASAQVAVNPKDMSGGVMPTSDIPVGTVTARLLRGNFDKPIAGHVVDFNVDGKVQQSKTDADGRASVSGLKRGARVRAMAVVDGERLESQEAVVADTGLRILLVATDPEAEKRAAEDKALAASSAVKGVVVIGPESRFIAEFQSDELTVFYQLEIINSARTPVDPGGPIVFDLPTGARGAAVMNGSSPQATANGPRITITGPFAPGVTPVQVAYTLPYSGPTARIEQKLPAALQQLNLIVQQLGGFTVRSTQLTGTREVPSDSGQTLIVGAGPGIPAGQTLSIEISGLPHRPVWPRNLALALVATIMIAGLWAAFTAPARRVSA